MKGKINKLQINTLYAFLFSLIFGTILVTFSSITLKFIAVINVFFGLFFFILYIINIFITKKIYVEDYLIWGLIFFNLLSLINAHNYNAAILGMKGRYEGILVLFSYYFLFLNTIRIKGSLTKTFIKIILLYGGINVFIGLLQVVSQWTKLFVISGAWYNAKGLVGNSNFFGTLMVICYLISLGIFQKESSKSNILILTLFTIGVVISGCLSSYLAVLIIFLFALIYNNKSWKSIKNYLPFLFFIVIYLFFATFLIKTLNKDILGINTDLNNIISGEITSKTGSSRLYIWNEIFKRIPKSLPFGIGVDNVYFIDNGVPICNFLKTECFDKAHNEFLQIAITEGLGSLLCYLVLIVNIILKCFPTISHKKRYILFLPFLGYLIQSFFNISTIRVSPIFYLIMGLIIRLDGVQND